MKFSARFIFSLFLVPYSLFLLISPTFAQTNEPIPPNTHNYVQTVMLDTISALNCQLTGIDPAGAGKKCLGYNQQTGELGFVDPSTSSGGAIGAMGGLIAVLYNPPLSSGDYFRYLAGNFGLVKPVYAQGVGFEGLKPLLAVWTVFRNLVYVLFAVAFILVGLAIMLRVRIDPRTVMTIQNQIPKLIIALLLVTFSYAIAGFLVDLMYVIIYLLFGVISGVVPLTQFGSLTPDKIHGANPFEAFGAGGILEIVTKVSGSVFAIIQGILTPSDTAGNIVGHVLAGVIAGALAAVACFGPFNVPGAIVCGIGAGLGFGGLGTSTVVGGVGSVIAFLIILIAVLWSLFRLWFALIMAYVMLLIDIVFAPFWILLGVLPGTPIGFGAWLRSILSNLSPFPVTIGMFLLAKIFMESFQHVANTAGGKAFMPPLIGNPGDNTYGALASFIGLGFILLTPQVVVMTKDFLKAPVFKYMPAIGQAIGVGPGIVGGTATQVFSPFGALAMFGKVREGLRGGAGIGGVIRSIAGFSTPIQQEVGTTKQESPK